MGALTTVAFWQSFFDDSMSMASLPAWSMKRGDSPLVATAIHDGQMVQLDVSIRQSIGDRLRLHEEDPFTGYWTSVADTRVVVHRSRFEVDLNRPREKAVYVRPADAWGLNLWKQKPSAKIVARSLALHDEFYREIHALLTDLVERHGRIVVLDLHSYNHQRDGRRRPPANPLQNPEVNVGTGTMQRERWAALVDRFIRDLSAAKVRGRHLDVRENVRFRGGYFSQWIHATFPESVCAIAIEFKKIYMDEWTGRADLRWIHAIHRALGFASTGILAELARS